MKKKITTALMVLTAALMLWTMAFESGKNHAICDAVCYIVDYEDPEAPQGDTILYIELDDNTYEHWLYIG